LEVACCLHLHSKRRLYHLHALYQCKHAGSHFHVASAVAPYSQVPLSMQ
jgi:hypothetical protein